MTNVIDVGELLPVRSPTFTNDAGTPANPAEINFQFTKPDGTELTTSYGGTLLPAVTRSSTGNYRVDLNIDQAGPWYYRWYSGGTIQQASRGAFDAVSYAPE